MAIVVGLAPGVLAQQRSAGRDFDAEYRTAVQSAKDAAGFEFLGTLVRTCLLPQSGGENTTDTVPDYIANPSKAPARETWYAEPAKVFDNLYFVGGKVHSAWALTTSDGIILIDTIYPYNSEELIVGGMQKLGLDPKDIKYMHHLARARRPHRRRGDAAEAIRRAGRHGRARLGPRREISRTGTRRWRRSATSSRPTA